MAESSAPLVIGALLGGAASLGYVSRTKALSGAKSSSHSGLTIRQKALLSVLSLYSVIAWVSLIVAIAVGDTLVIAVSGGIAVIVTAGAIFQWSRRSSGIWSPWDFREEPKGRKIVRPHRVWMRIATVTVAVSAFSLSLATGNAVPIATSAAILVAALVGFLISLKREHNRVDVQD
jgi:hypothetical protein